MTNRWRRALAAPSGLFLLAVLAAGLAAPLLPLADPTAIDISSKFLPPSLEHPFGTDLLGRDMLSRMIWGIRTTFVTALLTMIVTAGVGMIAGGAAAAARGRVDALIMRNFQRFFELHIARRVIRQLHLDIRRNADLVDVVSERSAHPGPRRHDGPGA